MPFRGKPGNGAKGGFLGGARSPRPRCKAVRKPRHNMIIGSKGTPGGLPGTCLGEARAFPAGVRSPPLRGGLSKLGWPCGESSGITRRAFFSEGRTPCVRVAWPGSCGGKIFPGHAEPPLGSDERLRLTLVRYKVIEAQLSLSPRFGIFLAILTQWSRLGTDPRGLRKGPSFPRWLRRQEGGGFCLSGREEIATEETDRPRHTMDTQ
jgi:hypothetical protein